MLSCNNKPGEVLNSLDLYKGEKKHIIGEVSNSLEHCKTFEQNFPLENEKTAELKFGGEKINFERGNRTYAAASVKVNAKLHVYINFVNHFIVNKVKCLREKKFNINFLYSISIRFLSNKKIKDDPVCT